MATQVKLPEKQASSGGGGILSAIGAVLGAALAPFTGGASLAGVAAAAGAGSTIGKVVGGVVAPPEESKQYGLGDAMARRVKPSPVETATNAVSDGVSLLGGASTLANLGGVEKAADAVSSAAGGATDSARRVQDSVSTMPYGAAMSRRLKKNYFGG